MAPSTPPTRLPSRGELQQQQQQQQRFVAAQHRMATLSTPTAPPLQPQATASIPLCHSDAGGAPASHTHVTQKRRRQRSPARAASISQTVNVEPAEGPRKTAYELDKEYRAGLTKEARELEERLDQLRLRAGLPTNADKQRLLQARRQTAEIYHHVYTSMRHQVQAQALVSEQLQTPPVNPLCTDIHLPRDHTRRRAILHGMKDVKLRRAAEIGVAHFAPLEANSSHLKEERFMSADGVYHCNRWDLNEFPQFQTAKQLYDTLLFWLSNIEIGITEMIGRLTLRGDNGDDEPTIWHQVLISTSEEDGYTEEFNFVTFAQFYQSYDLLDGEPLGVIAVDSVDADDLYPYQPHERLRKAFQVYHLINEVVVDTATGHRVPMLKTCLLNSLLPAQFPVEPRAVEKIHENMSVWNAAIVQYLRDYIVPP